MASAACIKTDGVPVELSVAVIFCAMMALLPIPVQITLPFEKNIIFTLSKKSLPIDFFNPATALASMVSVLFAKFTMCFSDFKMKDSCCLSGLKNCCIFIEQKYLI